MIRRPLKGYVPRPAVRADSYPYVSKGSWRRIDKVINWMLWIDRLGSDEDVCESRCSVKVFPVDEFIALYDKFVPDGHEYWEKINGRLISRQGWIRHVYGRVYNMYYNRDGTKRDTFSSEHPRNWPEYKELVNQACDIMGLERQFV